MGYSRRILMTTTSSLDGWTIEEHLGPVFAQFVIGTGIFADFFSSFTDFFGAHSRSYQKKLGRINQEALAMIEAQATALGANAVLGLRVDHDEISGTGKSMLMVTASGTAVRAQRIETTSGRDGAGRSATTMSAQALQVLLRRQELHEQARAGTLNWDDEEDWRFILENSMEELAPYALRRVEELSSGYHHEDTVTRRKRQFREYFLSLPAETAKQYLYSCLDAGTDLWVLVFSVIRDGNLFDASRVLAHLQGDNDLARRRSIQLVLTDPPYYSTADVTVLQDLEAEIGKRFGEAPAYTVKRRFGEKEVWKCACGNEVKVSDPSCGSCGRDRYGFPNGMLTANQAIEVLRRKIQILDAELRKAPLPLSNREAPADHVPA